MKILIIRNYPSYMAVKNNTYNIQEVGLAKALVRKGHNCDIIFWTDRQEETVVLPVENYGQISVFYRHGKTKLKNTVFSECEDLFSQYDILQPCEYNQIQAWILASKYPKKTIIYHGPYLSPYNKRYNLMCKAFDFLFLKKYIRKNTQFLAKSRLAQKFLTDKGIKEANTYTVGVGIDTQMLSSDKVKCDEPLYQVMKNDLSNLKILYIGRLEERRNIPFIIDVFKKVLEKNSEARLYMVGTGDKEYLEDIFSYIEKANVRDKVIWQEKMEQKYLSNIYQLADFFLLPTKYEIFGMVLMEAMYYNTVVLTTYNGGSSTLIESGKNGFVLENNDVEQWVECIVDVSQNMQKKNMIQNSASKTISERYTWDCLADCFIEQYHKRLEK